MGGMKEAKAEDRCKGGGQWESHYCRLSKVALGSILPTFKKFRKI